MARLIYQEGIDNTGATTKYVDSTGVNATTGNIKGDNWFGATGTLGVFGTMGGATVALQVSHDGGTTWTALSDDTTLDAVGMQNFKIQSDRANPYKVRLAITNLGASSDIDVRLDDSRGNAETL